MAKVLYSERNIRSFFGIQPTGVLHVGAHLAEEAPLYKALLADRPGKTIWVESQKDKCDLIREELDPSRNTVIEATIWDVSGEILTFFQSNNSESSSLLEFGKHSQIYPDVYVKASYDVRTSRLDDLVISEDFDFVNLDLQGVELRALNGLGNRLDSLLWIYCEVNKFELYKECCLVWEVDEFLDQKGFVRFSTRWESLKIFRMSICKERFRFVA